MNPLNGIKISAFRDAATLSAGQDRELLLLQRYLHFIVERNIDFKQANHQVSTTFSLCVCLAVRPDPSEAMEAGLQTRPEGWGSGI